MSTRIGCAMVILTVVAGLSATSGPVLAGEPDFVLKVSKPGPDPRKYTESFKTEAEATAWLWSRLKIDAVEEQTRALRIDFEQYKSVHYERLPNIAEQTGIVSIQMQPQLDIREQMLFSSYNWGMIRW